MNRKYGQKAMMSQKKSEILTAESTFAPATVAHFSASFWASLVRPGTSDLTLAEALERSPRVCVLVNRCDRKPDMVHTLKVLLCDLWVSTSSVQVIAHTSCRGHSNIQ